MNLLLGELIDETIKDIYENSYFGEAPRGTAFPYVVWRTPTSFVIEERIESVMLEIRVFDNKWNDISTLETITDTLVRGLNKRDCFDSNSHIFFQKESILQVDNEEERTKQRLIRMTVNYFDRR